MTLSLSPAALFVLIVLCVPFLWSGIVALLRRICAGETSLSDQQERAVLVLMVLPVFCGLAVVFLPGLMPHIPSPLPPMGEPQHIGGLGVVVAEEAAAPGFNLMPWVWAGLILFYLAGAALGLGRFARGYVRMREILRHSIGRDAVGDVRLTGAPVFDAGNPDPGLSGQQMKQLQRKLANRGHDVGDIDGILGAKSRAAVQQVQQELGLPADAWPTAAPSSGPFCARWSVQPPA